MSFEPQAHATRQPPRRPLARAPLVIAALALGLLVTTAARAAEPDYSGWQDLLKRYLVVQHPKGGPWDTRFDYEQLYVDEGIWTKHRADGLAALHTQLLAVTPSDMTPAERTAWAINAYNFMVVEHMTLHLLVPERKFMRYSSPREIADQDGPFFAAHVATVEGREYSLTGFERRFVYGDTTADPLASGMEVRTVPGDPRLMFAVCKAAVCCGPLLPWAYRADSLEKQLDRAARLALALPTVLSADEKTGELLASNRFFEERADFGGPQLPGLFPFIHKYGTPAERRVIVAHKLQRPTRFFEPKWKVNQYDRPKPAPPAPASTSSAGAPKPH